MHIQFLHVYLSLTILNNWKKNLGNSFFPWWHYEESLMISILHAFLASGCLSKVFFYILLNEALGLPFNVLHLPHASIEGQIQRPYVTIKWKNSLVDQQWWYCISVFTLWIKPLKKNVYKNLTPLNLMYPIYHF